MNMFVLFAIPSIGEEPFDESKGFPVLVILPTCISGMIYLPFLKETACFLTARRALVAGEFVFLLSVLLVFDRNFTSWS